MNNNYTYFNPNPSFMRSVPINPNVIAPVRATPLPRFSSLLGGASSKAASGIAGASASKITFSGILNGASKTLGVINQAIPVFYQVKPIWNNARTMFRVVKEINTKEPTSNKVNNTKQTTTNETKKEESNNSPTFFA